METTSPKEPEMKAAPRRNPRTKLFVEPNPILMRGLDIRTLFVGAFLYFGMSQLRYFLTVAVFSTASTTGRLIAATLTTATAQVFITFFAWLVIPELIGELSHPPHVIMLVAALLMCLFIVVTAMVFIFVFAMVGFAVESTNRMLPIRVFLTIVQAILTAAALLVCVIEFGTSLPDIVGRVVYIPNFLYWMGFPFVFALFICERETLSPRIRKSIPKKFAKRLCVFPFYTGAPWIYRRFKKLQPLEPGEESR